MSTVSATPELDFWEFVNCGICHLEFVKTSGGLSSAPFWLTECGHVVCNSHINADQSCAECGSQGIQLTPLAKELEPPMSNWFMSAPVAFDAVGYALRFQMNTMANLLRHFKWKYQQYRPLYDRLKEEHMKTKRLEKLVQDLQAENHQLREHLHNGFVGDTVNENSKRRRLDEEAHFSRHRTSSPHSATSAPTPVGPERLTLPPGRHQPQFNVRHAQRSSDSGASQQQLAQYAYVAPRSAHGQVMATPILSHAQSGPSRRAQEERPAQTSRAMPPPPVPTSRVVDTRIAARQPPSTPLSLPSRPSFFPVVGVSQVPSSSGTQRFVPSTPSRMNAPSSAAATPRFLVPQTGSLSRTQQQRFLPTNGSVPQSASLATSGMVSQAPSRSASMAGTGSGGQRAPFRHGPSGGLD